MRAGASNGHRGAGVAATPGSLFSLVRLLILASERPVSMPSRPRVAKRTMAEALVGSPAMEWLLKLPSLWRGVLVLAYHRIQESDQETPFDSGVFSATPSTFEAQLRFLTRHFQVVSPESIKRNPDSLGRRVVVTFDDGYRDNYELAFPLLREYGMPATFFLATGFLDNPRVPWWDELAWMVRRSPRRVLEDREWFGGRLLLDGDRRPAIDELTRTYKSLPTERTEAFLDFCADAAGTGRCDASAGADLWMTWEMAAELRDAGMTIGGHTATHPVLGRARPEVQSREVEECARRLREKLGVSIRFFAYPVGLIESFDDSTRRILREAGVELAFSLYGGYLRPGRLDPYDVPRASVGRGTSPSGFRAMLTFPRLFARW
ncbi:MAG: polysaccharide deacetylase family protein [bacterium]